MSFRVQAWEQTVLLTAEQAVDLVEHYRGRLPADEMLLFISKARLGQKFTLGDFVMTKVRDFKSGHSERVQLVAARDDSGNKNSIQAVGSTVTYLQRYTLLAVTGTSVGDQGDNDGRGAQPEAGPPPSSASEAPSVEAPPRSTLTEFAAACDTAATEAELRVAGAIALRLPLDEREQAKAIYRARLEAMRARPGVTYAVVSEAMKAATTEAELRAAVALIEQVPEHLRDELRTAAVARKAELTDNEEVF